MKSLAADSGHTAPVSAEATSSATPSLEKLAKLKQNPLSELRQVLLQTLVSPDSGDSGGTEGNYSFQVVWPVSLSEEWRLINYAIPPLGTASGHGWAGFNVLVTAATTTTMHPREKTLAYHWQQTTNTTQRKTIQTMRRSSILQLGGCLAAVLSTALFAGYAFAESTEAKAPAAEESDTLPKMTDFLFVQNSESVKFGEGTVTMQNVSPMTIAFADRPERIAGQMPTSSFVPMWGQGKDSFLKDPPNATLSVMDEKQVTSLVVTLTNPRLDGSDLTYDVKILEGKVPTHAGSGSLFIDIIGMPLTPLSYAGVRRRAWRRAAFAAPAAAYYGAPVVAPHVVYGPTVVYGPHVVY